MQLSLAASESTSRQCPPERPMTRCITEPQSEEGGRKKGRLLPGIAQVPFGSREPTRAVVEGLFFFSFLSFFFGVESDARVP